VGCGPSLAGVGLFFYGGVLTARGLYTLLTDPDLVGHNLLGSLCKGLVASLCSHTSVVWYGACATSHGRVQSSSETFTQLVGKVVQHLQSV
jgi:hypothetical protein